MQKEVCRKHFWEYKRASTNSFGNTADYNCEKLCIKSHIILTNPKRRRKKYRSSFSREHVLDDHQNKSHNVCKVFFRGILGYKSDKVITNTLIITRPEDIAPPPDKPDDTLYHAKFYYPVLQLT